MAKNVIPIKLNNAMDDVATSMWGNSGLVDHYRVRERHS